MAKAWQLLHEEKQNQGLEIFHLVKITNGSMKGNKSNDAQWKIIVNISSKSGKFTIFKNLDLTAFGGRLINHLTPSATSKLKLTRTICVLPSLHFLKLKTTPKTKLHSSIWKNSPFSDSKSSFQLCQMLYILGFIHYPNFSENARYQCHTYLV